jgi:hypothetical protein
MNSELIATNCYAIGFTSNSTTTVVVPGSAGDEVVLLGVQTDGNQAPVYVRVASAGSPWNYIQISGQDYSAVPAKIPADCKELLVDVGAVGTSVLLLFSVRSAEN